MAGASLCLQLVYGTVRAAEIIMRPNSRTEVNKQPPAAQQQRHLQRQATHEQRSTQIAVDYSRRYDGHMRARSRAVERWHVTMSRVVLPLVFLHSRLHGVTSKMGAAAGQSLRFPLVHNVAAALAASCATC